MSLPPLKQTPSPNYSSRGGQKVRLIVAHDCEGSYAGSISWFAQARSQVSAHLVLKEDGTEATQMVSFANKAWHAVSFNPFSEGIEAAGYASKGFGAPEFDALAALVAWRLKANEIPCQEANSTNNWTGYTEHWKLGAAGGGHSDFTTDSTTWEGFVVRVDRYFSEGVGLLPILGQAPPPPKPADFTPSGTTRHDFPIGSIEWVQMRLNALGYTYLSVDGIEGLQTQKELRHFQAVRGLLVDGIIGPQTIAALKEL